MRIEKQLVDKQYYGKKRLKSDIKYIVVQTVGTKLPHYVVKDGKSIQHIPDEYITDAISGGKLNKQGYLHGICTKHNSISIGVFDVMSDEDKQTCLNLIMTLKQRYHIDNFDIVRQVDVTGAVNPRGWYESRAWAKDITDKLIDV